MIRKRLTTALTIGILLAAHGLARAQDDDDTEQMLPFPEAQEEKEVLKEEPSLRTPLHFVIDLNMNSDYYTPRGLMVEDDGISFHLLVLGILDLYKASHGPVNSVTLTGGFWNNFQTIFRESPYNEVDPILGVDVTIYENWTLGATYVPFISPPHDFDTEHNIEFKIAYDDTDLLGAFALHPYIKPFWNFSGDSPVVLGSAQAWDFETGINPSVQLFQDSKVPLKINFPLFAAWGGTAWYGGPGTFLGHVSPGIIFSIPLSEVVSPDYGIWSFYAGVAYSRIVNDNLFEAGNIVSGNDERDIVLGSGGINVFIP